MKYRNCHGIEIKVCCASCRFKDLTRLMTSRYCTQRNKSVKPKSRCKQWAISEKLEAAGSAGGKVKRKEYLRYVLEVRSDESLADKLGIPTPQKTIDQIRQEFEKNNGSIYIEP